MSLYTPSCFCCGAKERRGCVRGYSCNCGGHPEDLGNLSVHLCAHEGCRKCFNHCECPQGFISASQMIALKKLELGLDDCLIGNDGALLCLCGDQRSDHPNDGPCKLNGLGHKCLAYRANK